VLDVHRAQAVSVSRAQAARCDTNETVTSRAQPGDNPPYFGSMKNTHVSRNHFLALAAVIFCSLPLCAADPVEVPWNQLCKAATGNNLMITTADGAIVDGYCMSITVDEVAIRTENQKVVKIARSALSKIQMHRRPQQEHPLKALGKGLHRSFRDGFDMLFTPAAPGGILLIPATAAWGVVAAPFCALGELKNKFDGPREVKVI
jgi:hypothetical protein